MVKRLKNNLFDFSWPTLLWINFLKITFVAFKTATLILILWSIWLTVQNYLAGFNLEMATANPTLGWAMLASFIFLYWDQKNQGVRPTLRTQLSDDILKYFSFHGRNIFWHALSLADRANADRLATSHVLRALQSNLGFRFTLARLGISENDFISAADNDEDNISDILSSALAFGIADKSRISWEDLLRSVILHSVGIKALLEQSRVTPDEAVTVVEWSKRTWYYRPANIRSGLLYELITPQRNINKAWSARPTPTLDGYSQNLTELARIGTLASAKVRQEEAETAMRILSRSDQNSVILLGEAGVGKTSVVGDIALKMLQNKIASLKDHKLIALNIGAMLGSSEGFERLFAKATREAALAGNVILFIGNISQVTKGTTSEGFDLSGILLSALEQSGLQMIATASPMDYKKYIEDKDSLRRFFTSVQINEMSEESAVLVLEDKARKIENRHRVLITLASIKTAIKYSVKFIHNSKLPDKAVDLLDEAAVHASSLGDKRVEASHVEMVMSSRTNVPVGELTSSERDKLKNLKESIQAKFIGQTEAVDGVVDALKRSRLGVSKADRPIGNFLFLGPTGVGKTELAKRLAENYFGSEADMIRLDMSEYQTKESSYRIFGAPAVSGDVALGGGYLTEAVRKTPFAVVLLDEIEKAHPDILNVFLQVLDEGRMTDNLGNTIDFTNTIIIATSNAQARFIQEAVKNKTDYNKMQTKLVDTLLSEDFRPEFINRFDGVMVFKPLTQEELVAIARIKINSLIKRIKQEKDITLTVSDDAINKLAELGYDPALGARPLERVIREKIETSIANQLLVDDNLKEITFQLKDLDNE
jgi:ATP-dependent Clp protease ATP-binding subunit ClpC